MPLFVHRIFHYAPSKPRHPLLRLVFGVFGLALLAVLVVVGLFVGVGMLLFAATRRMLRGTSSAPRTVASDKVIDGEFSVVQKQKVLLS
jgi:hypothetical protein